MEQVFRVVLSLSVSGSLVGFLILLLRPVTRRFFAKRWTYYLWLLLLVRLLVPIHGDVNLAGWLSEISMGIENRQDNVTAIDQAENAANGKSTGKAQAESDTVNIENAAQNETGTVVSVGRQERNWKAGIFKIASVIWIFGLFLTVMYRLYTYRKFTREIFAGCVPVTDQRVWNKSGEIRMRLGIGRKIPLYESAAVGSPMLIGLKKPYIVLPSKLLAEMAGRENAIGLILHHELVHYKKKDIWYKWLFQAALCIHWFNPFLHVFNRKFHADCELACDEAVMTLLTEEGRKIYGNVLLDAAENIFPNYENVPAMTLLEEKRTLKERLYGIAQYHKTGILTGLCAMFVLAVLVVVAVLCGAAEVSADSGEVFVMRSSSPGFMDWIMGNIEDASFTRPVLVNSKENSYQMYDDDTLIAGESQNDVWNAWNYYGGKKTVHIDKFILNGSSALWIVYANKETTLELTSEFTLHDGRFKVVQVMPDQTVQVLNESGEKTAETVTLPEGRNCFKMVGQKARLKKIEIAYDNEDQKDIDGIFASEEEEYAYRVKAGLEPIDMAKLDDVCIYLDDKEASELYRCAWESGQVLSDKNWENLFLYSDAELTSRYLLEALQDGKIREFDSRILRKTAYSMDAKTVSECFRYLLEQDKVSEADLENIFVYSDASLSSQYLVEALMKGKMSGFSGKTLSQISLRLPPDDLTDIVLSLGKDDLTFQNLRDHVFLYLNGEQNMQCVCHYIDLGNILTDSQLRDVQTYVSEENFYRVIEYNGKNK